MNLRLAIVSHYPLSAMGGVSIHLKQLAEAFVKIGLEVEVIAPSYEPHHSQQVSSYDFKVKTIPIEKNLHTVKILQFSYRVYKNLLENRRRFDAVHGSQWSMFFPCARKSEIDLPLVTKFHGTFAFGTLYSHSLYGVDYFSFFAMPIYNHVESRIARESDGLIFINKSVKKELEAVTRGNYCRNTRVIYNGVDLKRFRPLGELPDVKRRYGLRADDKILLYAGRLDPLKGVHKLIRVARRLMEDYPSLRVLIAGHGDKVYSAYLKNLSKPRNNFIFTGWIAHDRLPEFYSLADIVVFPSPYSAGNNLLEAMACGRPPVVVKGLGFDELIQQGRTGFVIDSINVEDNLEKLLRSILFDEKVLAYVGRNARNFVETNLSWEKTALNTTKFIRSLLR